MLTETVEQAMSGKEHRKKNVAHSVAAQEARPPAGLTKGGALEGREDAEQALWLQEVAGGGNRMALDYAAQQLSLGRQAAAQALSQVVSVAQDWFAESPDSTAKRGNANRFTGARNDRGAAGQANGEAQAEHDAAEQAREQAEREAERDSLRGGAWEARVRERAPEGEEDVYIDLVLDAAMRLREAGYANATPELVGALLDAEAGTRWSADVANEDSGARGLTQFIPSTWRRLSQTEGTVLQARVAELERERGEPLTDAELLALRDDPQLNLRTGIDYAIENLGNTDYAAAICEQEGVDSPQELSAEALFVYGYLAHHEGVTAEDRGAALDYLAIRRGGSARGRMLTAQKWRDNGVPLARRRLVARLRAAGLRDDMLPDAVQAELEGRAGSERDVVVHAYFSELDRIEPELQRVLELAYVAIFDEYVAGKHAGWDVAATGTA